MPTKEAISIINIFPAWYSNPQWWAIMVALLLGVIGIFQDNLRKLFFKPKINAVVNPGPPDCQKINLTSSDGRFITPSYYLRIKVENSGNYRLEDVEAMVIGIQEKGIDGEYKKKKDFLPINLLWSHHHCVTTDKIQPKAFKHLDLGPIANPGGGKTAFRFELFVQPNNLSGFLDPGDYIIEIMFLANNHKPVHKKYKFEFYSWSDSEEEMLTKNVIFKEI